MNIIPSPLPSLPPRHLVWSWLRVAATAGILILLSIGERPVESASHDDLFSQRGLQVADAERLHTTVVSPHLEAPLATNQNVLWCGTFQLTWNEACQVLGEDIHFSGPDSAVAALNKKSFTTQHLDEASYVALAGYVREGILGRIRKALADKFGGAASPKLIPTSAQAGRPDDLVAYAYLFKNLQFANPFERLLPIRFGRTDVPCFGFEKGKPGVQPLLSQVLIHDYQSSNDFVIELKTKAPEDRVILAKIPPLETLAATVAYVQARAGKGSGQSAGYDDTLKVPKFNFDITRRYREFEHRPVVLKNPTAPRDVRITSALQNIRFQMDEKGVVLKSESHMIMACSMPHVPRPEHIMIFDQPFLVLLQRAGAAAPYFAFWVGNADLLLR